MIDVLVIDDELSMPQASVEFQRRFPMDGVAMHFAATKSQALKWLEDPDKFKIVLLDMRFAGVSSEHGLEILEDLVSLHPQVPVVVMSSRREPEILIRAWDIGASSYIVKWSNNSKFSEDLEKRIRKYSR
jgi:DNA-binding NtrC family response regulator